MLVVNESNSNAVELACQFLLAGKIISFATDTVYGLAVDASNSKAVEALYQLKKRDEKKPIAIFVKDLAAAKEIFIFDDLAAQIAEKFLPGALTIILPTKDEALSCLAANLNQNQDKSLGFRIVDLEFPTKLLKKFGRNLAVTSANFSGEKSAINAKEVEKYFTDSNLALLVDSGETTEKIPSTVIKISAGKIDILRQGKLKISNHENF